MLSVILLDVRIYDYENGERRKIEDKKVRGEVERRRWIEESEGVSISSKYSWWGTPFSFSFVLFLYYYYYCSCYLFTNFFWADGEVHFSTQLQIGASTKSAGPGSVYQVGPIKPYGFSTGPMHKQKLNLNIKGKYKARLQKKKNRKMKKDYMSLHFLKCKSNEFKIR